MRVAAAIMLAAFALALASGCSSSDAEQEPRGEAAVAYANLDLANTRRAPSSLRSTNVSDLDPAWTSSLSSKREGLHFVGSPVAADGVAYIQDSSSNVRAVDLDSGETKWERTYDFPNSGPNGVILAAGAVFGATPAAAFALDVDTGQEIWSTDLQRTSTETIAMVPGYHDGLVYVSTAPGAGTGNEVGTLWAIDAETGEKVWHFDTVPRHLWGHPEINYGGGLYYAPAFDGEGSIYIGTSAAGPVPGTRRYPWGSSRRGPNLYSNSIVKLDEKTGEMEWHFQVTPHGLCTGNLVSPILTEHRGRKMVIGAGALGIVVALDRETGKLLWRRPVGKHNGHDNDGLLAMRGEYAGLKTPMTVYPGSYGGVASPMSLAGSTLFVPVVNEATRLLGQAGIEQVAPGRGELVALDVATGKVEWKRRFPSPLYGPTVVANDLVFADSLDGTLAAFDVSGGRQVWKLKLPEPVEGGMTAIDDTLLVRTGLAGGRRPPKLMAYRLAG